MDVQQAKQRFGIIGSNPKLDQAIDTAIRVAGTDLSVLITGESGTGKEVMPKIIHQLGARKHGPYVAVNCGAIPDGTVHSELFGHERGAYTGSSGERKGYFEVAQGGTIFLDEVGELPAEMQAMLLRVLESGEFIRMGGTKVRTTDARVVAATNVNVADSVAKGRFREDLYYRLNTVPIVIPPLRERKEDIHLLFRKFASDFAEKYRMPAVRLSPPAQKLLENYRWPGNIRQLKNVAEQLSIVEKQRDVTAEVLQTYLPATSSTQLPVLWQPEEAKDSAMSERELLYKVLFDMKKDVTDLKALVARLMQSGTPANFEAQGDPAQMLQRLYASDQPAASEPHNVTFARPEPTESYRDHAHYDDEDEPIQDGEVVEESLSLESHEIDLIKKALDKHNGRRKQAAQELGISERTLYRKIKEYKLD